MTLLLSEEDVEAVLDVRDCIDALEAAFREHAEGEAVNRPRSHTYLRRGPDLHYLFKTMDGGVPSLGVHALRLSSDHVRQVQGEGGRRRIKVPAAPGGRYVGLIILFDLEELVPLAIMPDGYLQRMRVGATSALAARYLARPEATDVGIVGTGWQAGAQLIALVADRDVKSVRVHSPTREHRERFARDLGGSLGLDIAAVETSRAAIEGAGLVALATNAMEPVLDGAWLEPGQHVGSVQGHELDQTTLDRAAVIGVRSREAAINFYAPGDAPAEVRDDEELPSELTAKMAELGDVVLGRSGRRSPEDITLFTGSHTGASAGLGIQFTAVAAAVYRSAEAAGRGRQLPTDWFTQSHRP